MSLILDALNRSRQDAEQFPGLATEHYSEADRATYPRWRGRLPWVGLCLALLVIAWLLLDRGDDRVVDEDRGFAPAPPVREAQSHRSPGREPEPVAAATVPAAENRTAPVGEPAAGPEPVAEKAAVVGNPESAAAIEAAPDVAAAVPREAAPRPDESVTALYASRQQTSTPENSSTGKSPAGTEMSATPKERAVTAPQELQEQPIDIEAMVSSARQEIENTRLAEHAAPFITDLSQQTKDRIPTIFYQRHDYSDSSGSSVVLNGTQLRVGGRDASGVSVKEILPDSVVLTYQGTEFRLRALNSWVNL